MKHAESKSVRRQHAGSYFSQTEAVKKNPAVPWKSFKSSHQCRRSSNQYRSVCSGTFFKVLHMRNHESHSDPTIKAAFAYTLRVK